MTRSSRWLSAASSSVNCSRVVVRSNHASVPQVAAGSRWGCPGGGIGLAQRSGQHGAFVQQFAQQRSKSLSGPGLVQGMQEFLGAGDECVAGGAVRAAVAERVVAEGVEVGGQLVASGRPGLSSSVASRRGSVFESSSGLSSAS